MKNRSREPENQVGEVKFEDLPEQSESWQSENVEKGFRCSGLTLFGDCGKDKGRALHFHVHIVC